MTNGNADDRDERLRQPIEPSLVAAGQQRMQVRQRGEGVAQPSEVAGAGAPQCHAGGDPLDVGPAGEYGSDRWMTQA